MKKILSILFSALILCALLSGCAKTEAAAAQSEALYEPAASSAEEQLFIVIHTDMDESEGTGQKNAVEGTTAEKENETGTEIFAETEAAVITEKDREVYSYALMESLLKNMTAKYPDLLTLESLAETADGRNVYCLRAGSGDAPYKVLFTASIHAREYITTELLMKQMSAFFDNVQNGGSYGDIAYRDMLKECALYFVPMVNPDGVTISQFGPEALRKESVLAGVKKIADAEGGGSSDYYRSWKSNAEGIDLNRQFDARWEEYNDHVGRPSADHYKGTAPGSTPEAAALIGLTERIGFDRTVSYHTAGNVIYWYFGQSGELYEQTKEYAERLSEVTGYPLDANYEALDPAGYKDWAICKRGIPSVTIEVGQGKSPLDHSQLGEICQRNAQVIEETVLSAIGR